MTSHPFVKRVSPTCHIGGSGGPGCTGNFPPSHSGGESIKIIYLSKCTVRSSAPKWKKGNVLKRNVYVWKKMMEDSDCVLRAVSRPHYVCVCVWGEGGGILGQTIVLIVTGSINKKFSFNHQRLLVSSMKRVWTLRKRQRRETSY